MRRRPRKGIGAAALALPILAALVLAELALSRFAPFAVASAGWATSANGARYGWGFDGGEMVFTRDADDGSIYLDRVNSRGWRDRERGFDKPDGVFRVLVLGDSNVWGYVVPADRTITRLLEDKLAARGIAAEVLNMGVSGWSTDQQLEALKAEGMRYRPDVVVLHFTSNDLVENNTWTFGGKFAARRPFYYTLENGAPVRHLNPGHSVPLGARAKEFLLRHVELVKRGHAAVQTIRALRRGRWAVTEGHVRLLKLNFGDRATPAFLAEMTRLAEKDQVSEAELGAVAERHGLADRRDFILRVCESANRVEGNLESEFTVPKPWADAYWQLFFALVREIRDEAARGGARLVLSSDVDEGRWLWERSWGRVSPDPEAKARFLHANTLLRDFAAAEGIPFAEPAHLIRRARNDAHPNAAGNAAVADNILDGLAGHGLLPPPNQPPTETP